MFDIHMGIPASEVKRVQAGLRGFHAIQETYADGDDWNVWGEKPTDDNRHVIARVSTLGQAIDTATAIYENSGRNQEFIPLQHATSGDILVVSTTEDWAEQYFLIGRHGAKQTMANRVKDFALV